MKKLSKVSILMGERCQALECGRARYLPSLIALLFLQRYTTLRRNGVVTLCARWAMTAFKQRCVDVVYDKTLPQCRWPLDAAL